MADGDGGFFVDLRRGRPDTGFPRLAEIFHLEDQLDRTDTDAEARSRTEPTYHEHRRRPALPTQAIELPWWAFGNSGTRFKVFGQPGDAARPSFEKIADAAQVHRYTGVAPSVALHIPWDLVEDFGALRRHAEDLGVRLGAINSNMFQDDDYMLGSLTHPDPQGAPQGRWTTTSSASTSWTPPARRDLKIWLADGPNYPGQDDLRARQDRLAEGLAAIYGGSPRTSGWCWSTSSSSPPSTPPTSRTGAPRYCTASRWASRRWSCLDTGHHAPGTNIEFIVVQLLRLGRLGAFDFNSRFYADDDLMVGAADPFQLFRIMDEIVARRRPAPRLRRGLHARPVPQHRAEDPRPDPVGDERPGDDRPGPARRPGGARRPRRPPVTCSARTACSWTPSTPTCAPDLARWRETWGLPADPMAAYAERPATRRRSPPSASAAPRPAGAPEPERKARPPTPTAPALGPTRGPP